MGIREDFNQASLSLLPHGMHACIMHLPTRITCILILKLLSHNQVPSFPPFYIHTSNPTDHFSLGSYLHRGECYNCLSILVHPMCYCQSIHLEALVAQINDKNIHHRNTTCKCVSHTIAHLVCQTYYV